MPIVIMMMTTIMKIRIAMIMMLTVIIGDTKIPIRFDLKMALYDFGDGQNHINHNFIAHHFTALYHNFSLLCNLLWSISKNR